MNRLRRIPFRRVLYRPNLLLGGERGLVIAGAGVLSLIPLSDVNVIRITIAVVLWFTWVALTRWMAKIDPHMSIVYLRSLKYKAYYPARSRAIYKS